MRLCILYSILLIIAVQCRAGDDDEEEKNAEAPDIKGMFDKFFKHKGSRAFQNFLKDSGKKFQKKLSGQPDSSEDNKDNDDDDKKDNKKEKKIAKKPEEIPLPGKVFAFYGKTFGCTNSKVYEEFIKNYKDKTLPTPPVEEEVDDAWLKKLAKKEVEVDDSSKPPSVEDASEKMKKLEKEQVAILKDGVEQMPMDAQLFLRFVKSQGCQDTQVANYKKFNELMKEEVAKKKGKKMSPSYYLAKGETIIADEFQQK